MSNSVNLSLDVTKTGIQNPLIKVRQGDGGFETLHTTVTSNGEPLDLQGWTITFMGTTAGNHKIIDANVKVVEAPNGIFDYTPSKTWGMDIGEFKMAYFKFVKGDGSASSANFRVSVIEAVDLTQDEAKNYISVVDTTIADVKQRLTSSLASVIASVATTSSAVGSLSAKASSTATSAVDQINSAASSASSVATSAVNNVSTVASNAVANVNSASNVYLKKTQQLPAVARDFNYLARHMQTYQGTWWNRDDAVLNGPTANWTWSTIEVVSGNAETSGVIRTTRFGMGDVYSANVSGGNIQKWSLLANDDNVVHKSGDTMTGGLKGGQVNLPASGDLNTLTDTGKYYQVANFNVANWTNRPSNAPNLAFSVDVIGQANQSLTTQVYYVHTTSRMWVRTMYLNGTNMTTSQWVELANDANVVHNAGTETIAGDKTFTGNSTFSGTLKSSNQYIDVRSRIKSVDASGVTSMWFGWQVYWTVRNGYVTYQIRPTSTGTITPGSKSDEALPVEARPLLKVFVPLRWGGQGFSINTDGKLENDTGINIDPNASWSTAVSATAQGW